MKSSVERTLCCDKHDPDSQVMMCMDCADEESAASEPSPAWHDRPTVPGRWLVAESSVTGWEVWEMTEADIADADALGGKVGGRWFGPIPADGK